MKIACIGNGWYEQSPGGLEKYLYGMTHALLSAGDAVDLFVTGDPHLEGPGGNAYSIGQPGTSLLHRMIDARLAFAKSFREPYDAINLHFAMNALPLIPFIKHETPRVVHFHGPWGHESRAEGGGNLSVAIKRALEQFVFRRADRFIVLSSAFKAILVDYGVAAERIYVVPMGIDCSFFKPPMDRVAVRAELGWPVDVTVFFTARRLVNRVGLLELLQATRILSQSDKPFVVKIAGKGPLKQELEAAIIALGVSNHVELLGFVPEDDLVRSYGAADVTLLPSQSLEGFGTIIAESLACGTPAVVTPIGGMPEVVAPLGPHLISRSATPEDIAESMASVIDRLFELPDQATCRTYALTHFHWSVVIQEVRRIFANP